MGPMGWRRSITGTGPAGQVALRRRLLDVDAPGRGICWRKDRRADRATAKAQNDQKGTIVTRRFLP